MHLNYRRSQCELPFCWETATSLCVVSWRSSPIDASVTEKEAAQGSVAPADEQEPAKRGRLPLWPTEQPRPQLGVCS